MKTLRHIVISCHDYDPKFRSELRYANAYLANYLSREIRKARHRAGISMISADCSRDLTPCRLVEGILCVPVKFEREEYQALDVAARSEFFLLLIEAALRRTEEDYPIPASYIRQLVDKFRVSGYRNEWVQKRKTFKKLNATATLLCSMDGTRFSLRLQLENKNSLFYSKEIMSTPPDEIFFSKEIKDIVLEDDCLIVSDFQGKPSVKVPLSEILFP